MDPSDLPALSKKHTYKSIQNFKEWWSNLGADSSFEQDGNGANLPGQRRRSQSSSFREPSNVFSKITRTSTSTGEGSGSVTRASSLQRPSSLCREATIPRGVILQTSAADKFLGTATHSSTESKREKLPAFLIHPLDWRYRWWWYTTVLVAAITSILEPFVIAFTAPGLYPYNSATSILEYLCITLILIDVFVSFNVSRYVDGELVTDRKQIAKNYCKLIFWVDVLSILPFDEISLAIAGLNGPNYVQNPILAQYLSLFKLIRMLRMYRLSWFFSYLTYNLASSLLVVTIVRNVYFTFFLANFWACLWYFEARQSHFNPDTWVGAEIFPQKPTENSAWYIYSLYFSMVTLATVGYGDIRAFNVVEAGLLVFWILFLFFFTSYIIGSITLLVVKSDERVGRYRDQMQALQHYGTLHELSPELRESMLRHLKLHFNNQQSSDEIVLQAYPSTIRRQVLRYLYLPVLQESYLFLGAKPRFMDALLAVARVELYLPHVEIVSTGDFVNELFVIAAGQVMIGTLPPTSFTGITTPTTETTTPPPSDVSYRNQVAVTIDSSLHGASMPTHILQEGDVIGEVAFFTGTAQIEPAITLTTVRVLAISKTAYEQVASTFSSSARSVLTHLQQHTEDVTLDAFPGAHGLELFQKAMQYTKEHRVGAALAGEKRFAHPGGGGSSGSGSGDNNNNGDDNPKWRLPRNKAATLGVSDRQEAAIGRLLRVRHVVAQAVAKHDEDRATEWLYSASRGDVITLKEMLEQGIDVDTVDYDGRSALMLAAARGHSEALQVLIRSGADVNLVDTFSGTALWEACKAGHDECASLLLHVGARLGKSGTAGAALMCNLVAEGDLKLLRRLLNAGVDPNIGDYDLRTALHIAASEGNLPAVELLVVEGNADPTVHDRWGQTPLDEAIRVGATAVQLFLEEKLTKGPREEDEKGKSS